ncbi:glycosyltransferase family 1 protein [Fictibacillus sp. FJAT-27399]|uniref:glycosyltransferase family 1 protein n=1 Tax=Fictibacillus sp. FJAT-27399 TaxID=1729689 RepID=UPI000785BD56|nr:glycosyltransferase family 1 protein [Fictibacillus sp. FJAT-27399]
MIKVLQVIGSLNNGGSQAMIMNLYRNIDHSKIQFDFIIDRENELFYAEEIKALGGKIYFFPTFNIRNIFKYLKSWNDFFKEHPEYKVIHGHVRSTASIYLSIAKKYGVTTIAHSHSTSSGTGPSAIVKNLLQYPVRYLADYLFTCSKAAGEWLYGKKACEKRNFQILKNAIDTRNFIFNNELRNNKRKELKIEGKFVIGHVGRFNTPKNHEFLIDIFKAVHDKNENSVLLLVGDGNLKQSIEKKIYDLGMEDKVILTGVRSDIPDLLQSMDVFLFPSIFEGLPVTLIEAQAAGLPCVISKNITDEINVTSLVNSVSLLKSANFWAEKILEIKQSYERENNYNHIVKAGYDITETAKWYQEFIFNKKTLKM